MDVCVVHVHASGETLNMFPKSHFWNTNKTAAGAVNQLCNINPLPACLMTSQTLLHKSQPAPTLLTCYCHGQMPHGVLSFPMFMHFAGLKDAQLCGVLPDCSQLELMFNKKKPSTVTCCAFWQFWLPLGMLQCRVRALVFDLCTQAPRAQDSKVERKGQRPASPTLSESSAQDWLDFCCHVKEWAWEMPERCLRFAIQSTTCDLSHMAHCIKHGLEQNVSEFSLILLPTISVSESKTLCKCRVFPPLFLES